MRICLVGKYPPIEGGVSSRVYWMARGLAAKGHEIHVVTNSWEVEKDYREDVDDIALYKAENLTVHSTNPFQRPHYIPYSNPYIAKIASRAIDAIREHNLEIIDSWYILPYVISGFIAKIMTNTPQVMRHAGSDITRLALSPDLNTLFIDLFKKVDGIATHSSLLEDFTELGIPEERLFVNITLSIDTKAFNPSVEPIDLARVYPEYDKNTPVVTYIGKTGAFKGVYELVKGLSNVKMDFLLLLVTNPSGIDGLYLEYLVDQMLKEKTVILDFQPPWKIPSIIKASTVVVHLEHDFPIAGHMPILPREVMATGGCPLLSNEIFDKNRYLGIQEDVHAIKVDPNNISELSDKLSYVIEDSTITHELGTNARELSEQVEDFDSYIKSIEDMYSKVLSI